MIAVPTMDLQRQVEKDLWEYGVDTYTTPMELIMAGCVCVVIPLLIVFLCNQDKFMSSVSMGAVKG